MDDKDTRCVSGHSRGELSGLNPGDGNVYIEEEISFENLFIQQSHDISVMA